eukprot:CAMPEP_0178452484 /NCGR_PEP_ID=MMETSP0689_2-20121128/44270_1 /TAXON_ID=160604 /ORGANISM="Amphidinium massartii, Strain CS-259" /LENGTH=80 /DNA_ID=CAMNT_0020078195 /DNA_START=28 /DNA_END=267 /DNA_ORIENTATION=-
MTARATGSAPQTSTASGMMRNCPAALVGAVRQSRSARTGPLAGNFQWTELQAPPLSSHSASEGGCFEGSLLQKMAAWRDL